MTATNVTGVSSGAHMVPLRWSLSVAIPFLVLVVVLMTPSRRLVPESVLAGATLTISLIPVLRRLGKNVNVIEPIIPASLALAVLFGVRPLIMIHDSDITYFGMEVANGFRAALFLCLVGTIAFVVTYEVTYEISGRKSLLSSPTAAMLSIGTSAVVAASAALLGFTLFAVHLWRHGFLDSIQLLIKGYTPRLNETYAASSEYLTSAPILSACGAVIIVTAAGRRRLGASFTVLSVALCLSAATIFMLTGARRFVLPAVGIPVVAGYLARESIPRARTLVVVLPIVFLLVATIPYARAAGAREQGGGALTIYAKGLLRPDRTVLRFLRGHDTEMVAALAAEVETLSTGKTFFYGKATVGDLLLAPVPSAIVTNKPTTARDELLIRVFGSPCVTKGGRVNTCADFSAIGTFYQDFWIIGVLGGMALLGLISAAVWNLYRRDSATPGILALSACWIVFLPIVIRAGAMPACAWFFYFAVPSVLGLRLSAALQRRSGTVGGN